jgi:16S rRNA (cytosine967-C5)-methyltransferase
VTAGTQQAKTPAVTSARAVATEVCADLRRGEFLDQSFERRVIALDARDRRWTRELVYGMLRRRARIDALLAPRVHGSLARLDGDVLDLLRLGVYQLLEMGSVPAYAAIAQTVELVKRRHGLAPSRLVNAVLRRLDRERADFGLLIPEEITERLALTYSHPQWLVARWIERFGAEDTERLLSLNDVEATLIVRPFGIADPQFVYLAGLTELVIGAVILSGNLTRPVIAVGAILFTLTLPLFGWTELLGHLTAYGIMFVLFMAPNANSWRVKRQLRPAA